MSTILVTGSTAGIGAGIVRQLAARGHRVIAHARNAERARDAVGELPPGTQTLLADLTELEGVRHLADAAAAEGVDVLVSNAGIAAPPARVRNSAGVDTVFAVNALAPHALIALLPDVARVVVVASDSFRGWRMNLDDITLEEGWTRDGAYANSKLALSADTLAWARRRPETLIMPVHPGWVRTKMAGDAAELSVEEGADTPAWLADADFGPEASGKFYLNRESVDINPQMFDLAAQEAAFETCRRLTGLPE